MIRRRKTRERRPEIVEAALALLAEVPMERLTTRAIARSLGISQPALFRHFRSKADLLVAVVDSSRETLASLAESVLREQLDAVDRLEAIFVGLMTHVEQHPGLPTILFADPRGMDDRVRNRLTSLLSMQRNLIAELVRDGQRTGAFSPSIEPTVAATAFVSFVQGVVFEWRIGVGDEPPGTRGRAVFQLWLAALQANAGVAATDDEAPREPVAGGVEMAVLDTRPLFERGEDPLDAILERVDRLASRGALEVTTPFRPAPLLALLEGRGLQTDTAQRTPDTWSIIIYGPSAPRLEDLTELDPPEPLERVLAESSALESGGAFLARLPRFPRLLVPLLRERGLRFEIAESPDGSTLIQVSRP